MDVRRNLDERVTILGIARRRRHMGDICPPFAASSRRRLDAELVGPVRHSSGTPAHGPHRRIKVGRARSRGDLQALLDQRGELLPTISGRAALISSLSWRFRTGPSI